MYQKMLSVSPLSQVEYDVMLDSFKEYMVLGGMPAVVFTFVTQKNYSGTLKLQKQLLLDYEEDITKYANGLDKGKILDVYRKIPVFLGKDNKKFQISKVRNGARNRKQNGLRRWKMTDDYRIQNGKKVLTFYPVTPILMSKDPKWKEHIQVTGYWYHPEEDARKYVPDSDLMSFLKEGEKPISICFGKAEADELAKLQYLTLEVLKKTKLRAVVQADQIAKTERTVNDQLFFVENIPYSWMFQQVKAVVHHGGNTTNGLGLWAGLPTLVIPLALDQYFYGRAIYENGCGPKPLYIRKKCVHKNK